MFSLYFINVNPPKYALVGRLGNKIKKRVFQRDQQIKLFTDLKTNFQSFF